MIFVEVESVVAIHAVLIERFGGTLGLRDEGLLRSALAQPEATFGSTRYAGSSDRAAWFAAHKAWRAWRLVIPRDAVRENGHERCVKTLQESA